MNLWSQHPVHALSIRTGVKFFIKLHSFTRFYFQNFQSLVFGYRKIASSNTSCLEAHAELFRLLIKGIFDPYVLEPFDKMLISKLVTPVRTLDYTVYIVKNN